MSSNVARFSVVLLVLTAAHCKPKPQEAPRARFAVGSVPYYAARGITEGRACETVFDRGAQNGRPLTAAGRFTGRCGEFVHTFEAVPVARVTVITNSSHVSLAPFELDHARPEQTISLLAMPYDAAGAVLDHGANPGYATWTPSAGCDAVVRLRTNVGASGNEPADSVQVTALAAGTCAVSVEYLGARTTVNLTVR